MLENYMHSMDEAKLIKVAREFKKKYAVLHNISISLPSETKNFW